MAAESISLEDVVTLAMRLSPRDKLHLVERVLPDLAGSLSGNPSEPHRRSLLGLCADLGRAPSADDIDKVRQEIWRSFPREDV